MPAWGNVEAELGLNGAEMWGDWGGVSLVSRGGGVGLWEAGADEVGGDRVSRPFTPP